MIITTISRTQNDENQYQTPGSVTFLYTTQNMLQGRLLIEQSFLFFSVTFTVTHHTDYK
jgi:hypothetical protein